ncbi:MAG: hypothetical protein M3365_04375 [Gemmatimonadota bacterium]|nr:hypothetical protein [Gemmatimonadota bacterium]
MLTSFQSFCLAATVLTFCSSGVFAQSVDPVTGSKWGEAIAADAASNVSAPTSRSIYDSRALRLESDWGRLRILQGADGLVVGTAGVFRRANAEKIVAGSARAETEARLFQASHRRGALAGAVGAVTLVVGVVASSSNSNNAATPVLIIAGAGAMAWGAGQLNSAYSSLSRAIWWYNRDIAR